MIEICLLLMIATVLGLLVEPGVWYWAFLSMLSTIFFIVNIFKR